MNSGSQSESGIAINSHIAIGALTCSKSNVGPQLRMQSMFLCPCVLIGCGIGIRFFMPND